MSAIWGASLVKPKLTLSPGTLSILFVDNDAPTLEDILESRKLMDAERKRVFAIPLY
jgi:hypothetical protein